MGPISGSLVLLRKVQYGYCLLPHEARVRKFVAEMPPSTLLGLNSGNKIPPFGNPSGVSRNFLACAQASNLENDFADVAGIRAILRGFRTKGFSERILAWATCLSVTLFLQTCTILISSCMETNTGHNAERNPSLCPHQQNQMSWSGAGLLTHVSIDT